jgi:hypothetical protein
MANVTSNIQIKRCEEQKIVFAFAAKIRPALRAQHDCAYHNLRSQVRRLTDAILDLS